MTECVSIETEVIAASESAVIEFVSLETEVTVIEFVELAVQGPPGPPGPIGPPGDAFTLVASQTLSGHRVLAANGDGQAIYASHTDYTALQVQGLSTQSGIEGDVLIVANSGPMPWPAGGLAPGLPLFLTTDGQLSHIPPTSGWIRQIAVAIDADTISIDIGPAWRAGE